MKFNSLWCEPFEFKPDSDDWSVLEKLGGKGRGGVYLIRDNQDGKNLYLGKASNTASTNIYIRLQKHMRGNGNKQIAERVRNREIFTIRWIESRDPALTESALLVALNTSDELSTGDNRRVEWQDKYTSEEVIAEAERIGIYSSNVFAHNLCAALFPEAKEHQSRQNQSKSVTNAASMNSSLAAISVEDTQVLLYQLKCFQETIGGDWRSVISQWQNLQNCWQDRQYDRFEPFFEQLCHTYDQCEQQCEEYTQFLQERIRASEDAAATLNI